MIKSSFKSKLFYKLAQDSDDNEGDKYKLPEKMLPNPNQLELFPEHDLVDEVKTCSYDDCENALTEKELNDSSYHDYRGKVYCSEHAKECENCSNIHPIDEMNLAGSPPGYYCEDCYGELFAFCPVCEKSVEIDEFYSPTSRQARNKHDDRAGGGCSECSMKCSDCDKVVSTDNSYQADGDSYSYCESCFWEHYTSCIECNEYVYIDDSIYVEGHDGSYCPHCFRENFYSCYECNEPVEKNEAVEFDDEWYHEDCAPDGAKKLTQLEAEISPEALPSFTYTGKDRLLTPLSKLLPISVKNLKQQHPRLAAALSDLINFAKGATLTPEVVEAYKATLESEEFPVEYSTWSGMQRSVRSKKPQLVLKILASEQMLNKLREKPVLIDLFNSINDISKRGGHPSSPTGLGWARIEISPDKEYMLVDEIQMDHMNSAFKLKQEREYLKPVRDRIKSTYNLTDEEIDKSLDEFLNILKDFPNIASVAVERFAKQNGIKRIFWHTYESGMKLKGNKPPKSLYTTTPKEHFYLPSGEKPFGLEGEFLSKEAKKAYILYKLAKLWNIRN